MNTPHLYYEEHGTEGPHLLLVHGMLTSRAQWMPNIDALTAFCRPVVVELFGHGRSPSPTDPEYYSPDYYVCAFEDVRRDIKAKQWFTCGQSLGASLTLRYGLTHPDRITAQVFTNSRSALSDESYEGFLEVLKKQLARDGQRFMDNFPLHPSRSKRLPDGIKKAMVRDAALATVAGFGNTMLYTVPQCSLRSRLGDTQVPTLMIVGRYDKRFAPLRDIAARMIPNLEIRDLEGGHAVNIDAADDFNSAVRDFVLRRWSTVAGVR